ncbi:3'(2'),5'-bisphosphate nucleotidase CysQ [Amylibacter ulvae]|uniref:3'(2'),5'-bisphosphate nucleotidase CysQ n=1 Tax=Paramylibacter ulvae TaxID=1651968 RepID=A0ABQ3CWP6_9RHOB|nr:3'(2'),5'-bisphosphate nucleotidase CysQ [Amylibacter ulvae]
MPVPDLTLLTDAALASGEIAMRFFRKELNAWDKGGGQGPVSEADLAIDKMLCAEFGAARPDYGWLSEETDDDPARLDCENVFIVDPIDGTRSFINGHENFAVSLAVAKAGEVTAAVVHLPAKGLTYAAALGAGATLNGEPIRHNGNTEIRGARILASGSQTKSEMWVKRPPPIERHFRSSLAYRMCLVAQGRFDGMLTLRPTWEWDVAGGDLICREAGVSVTMRNGQSPKYNSATACFDGLIAATPVIHTGLLDHL